MLYPPTLTSTQPVFIATDGLKLKFSLNFTAPSEIGHYQLYIVKADNNAPVYSGDYKAVSSTGVEYNYVYYKEVSEEEINKGEIWIGGSFWTPNETYKVQMRFGSEHFLSETIKNSEKQLSDERQYLADQIAKLESQIKELSPIGWVSWSDFNYNKYKELVVEYTTLRSKYKALRTTQASNYYSSHFSKWRQEQIEANAFSEWSTVMLVRPITPIVSSFKNTYGIETTTVPEFSVENVSTEEPVTQYRFALYKGKIDADTLIASTPIEEMKNFVTSRDQLDSHRFNTVLENDEQYTVVYWGRTLNGYEIAPVFYPFKVRQVFLGSVDNVSFFAEEDPEDGCIRIYLGSKNNNSLPVGTYIIRRASEESNFKAFYNIRYYKIESSTFKDTRLIFTDYTVESGIQYQYALSYINPQTHLWTNPQTTDKVAVHFDYSYLYRNGTQLKLMFNQKISSFKHTTLRAKQDTLGDKYPHLVQNGNAYYAEFPISGLISFAMDDTNTFLHKSGYSLYYRDDKAINENHWRETTNSHRAVIQPPAASASESSNEESQSDASETVIPQEENTTSNSIEDFSTNLSNSNIFIERKFREKVEEFLNDFTYKLYKSPTEGNIVVSLLNVSLTPKAELGRMIYEFSANAYEVLDNTLENLNEYGVITIDPSNVAPQPTTEIKIGQLIFIPYEESNIQQQIESEMEGFSSAYEFQKFNQITVRAFPTINLALIDNDEEQSILTRLEDIIEKSDLGLVPPVWGTAMQDTTYYTLIQKAFSYRKQALEATESEGQAAKEKYFAILKCIKALLTEPEGLISIKVKEDKQSITFHVPSPSRPYIINTPVNEIEGIFSNYPVLIDYVCTLKKKEDTEQIKYYPVSEQVQSERLVFGQIKGAYKSENGTDLLEIIKNQIRENYGSASQSDIEIISEQTGMTEEILNIRNNKADMTTYSLDASVDALNTLIYFEIEAATGTELELNNESVVIGTTPIKDEDGFSIGAAYIPVGSIPANISENTTLDIPNMGTTSPYNRVATNHYCWSFAAEGTPLQSLKLVSDAYIVVNYLYSIVTFDYEADIRVQNTQQTEEGVNDG